MNLKRHIRWVPLYNIDPQTDARVESSTLIVRSRRHSGGSGGGASPAFCRGACRLAHLPAVMPHTAIPDAHAALKGFEKTANARR